MDQEEIIEISFKRPNDGWPYFMLNPLHGGLGIWVYPDDIQSLCPSDDGGSHITLIGNDGGWFVKESYDIIMKMAGSRTRKRITKKD